MHTYIVCHSPWIYKLWKTCKTWRVFSIGSERKGTNMIFNSDIAFVIVKDLGDHAALSYFNGIVKTKNVIIISEEFMFDKFSILHYFGKIFIYLHTRCGANFWTLKLCKFVKAV